MDSNWAERQTLTRVQRKRTSGYRADTGVLAGRSKVAKVKPIWVVALRLFFDSLIVDFWIVCGHVH